MITGGAQGVGESITRSVGKEGAIPVIVDSSREAGEKLVTEIREAGGDAYMVTTDLQMAENCKAAVEETLEKYSHIDALINTVGINDAVGLESGGPDEFCESLEKNLYHYYYMAHYCLSALKKARGAIVNVSAKAPFKSPGNMSGYVSAKGAQLALTREWAVELLRYEIRVNAVLPVATASGQHPTFAEEIASMAAYLISEKASHITGQHICVNRGDSL